MKKLVTFLFLVLNVLSFSDTFNDNEDERTILKQEQRSEQERLQKEFQKREGDFNKLKLEKAEISVTKNLNLKKSFLVSTKKGKVLNIRDLDVAYAKPLTHSGYIKPKNREIYFSATLKVKF